MPHSVIKSFITEVLDDDRRVPEFDTYEFSGKTSAFTSHSLFGCIRELELLSDSLLESVKVVGGPILKEHIEVLTTHISYVRTILPFKDLRTDDRRLKNFLKHQNVSVDDPKFLDHFHKHCSSLLRRIAYFSDPDAKTRVIAMADYWSQSALSALHDKCFSFLRSIPQDQTFDQGKGLKELKFGRYNFHCLDLSAFTDRFPRSTIVNLLTNMYGETYADHVMNIFVGQDF